MELSPLVAELERLYIEAAHKWWTAPASPTLLAERPVITIASRGRKSTVNGWYTPAVWSDAVDDVLDFLAGEDTPTKVKAAEIVIASEVLGDPVQALAELVRQMEAHRDPALRPKDGSFYYGGAWFEAGIRLHCYAEVNPAQPGKGLSLWTPDTTFKQWANENINAAVWNVSRESAAERKVGSRMKKWTCGCTIVRCATKLESVCSKCGFVFTWAEAEVSPFIQRKQGCAACDALDPKNPCSMTGAFGQIDADGARGDDGGTKVPCHYTERWREQQAAADRVTTKRAARVGGGKP